MTGTKAAVDAEHLAQVTANFRQYLMGWGDAGRATGDVDYFRSGLAQPQFNGVVRLNALDAVGQAVQTARTRLAGVPWWWWVGPDSPDGTRTALAQHGAVALATLPLMVLPLGRPAHPTPSSAADLRIEAVEDPGRLTEVVRTYSASIGIEPALETGLVRMEARRADNTSIVRLAAVLGDRVVGTTTVITAHGVAGIFLVHVAESHRRRGVGSALTTAALHLGRERGMQSAALLASPAGEPLYRRSGFATVSEYRLFTLPAAARTGSFRELPLG
jgi:ribosomal protein S18 acetylase RimI-like enzyme